MNPSPLSQRKGSRMEGAWTTSRGMMYIQLHASSFPHSPTAHRHNYPDPLRSLCPHTQATLGPLSQLSLFNYPAFERGLWRGMFGKRKTKIVNKTLSKKRQLRASPGAFAEKHAGAYSNRHAIRSRAVSRPRLQVSSVADSPLGP